MCPYVTESFVLKWDQAMDFRALAPGVGLLLADLDEDQKQWIGWSFIQDEFVEERRWGNTYFLVMKDPNGQFWGGAYSIGTGDNESYRDEDVTMVKVYPRTVTTIVYEAEPQTRKQPPS